MNTFRVQLLGSEAGETIPEVLSFVGQDASGSFGLMAHHARFMTVLSFGLARLRLREGAAERTRYLGLPGGVLVFADNELRLATRRYLLGDDAAALGQALARQMLAEEQALAQTLAKLRRLESEMLQRLVELQRG
jgi:F-type H+-transporting ATPase subunit epsilon